MRIVFIFLLLFAAASQGHGSDLLVLQNATVIDPARGTERSGMTIVIKGERISAVFPDGSRPIPDGARIDDLGGRFVMPGLIDSHTHLTPLIARSPEALDRELERKLRGGIVAVRDMAGNARAIAAAKKAIASGEKSGPDIVFSAVMGGPHFMAADGRVKRASAELRAGEAPWAQTVTAQTDVGRAVSIAAGTGARALKLYAEIDGERIRALTEEAHRQGLKVWAHGTVYPAGPMEVVKAGTDVVSHLCSLAWEDADLDPAAPTQISMQNRPSFDPARVEADSPEMSALFTEMARRGTILDATLSNHLRDGDDRHGCTSALMIALAKAAHRAGVRIAAGTDYNTPEDDPWPSLHREIEALVEHGILTPAQALAAATINGAQALGAPDDYGTIEQGRLASLLVLAENPLKDIRALRGVVMVIKRGSVVLGAEERASVEQQIRDALLAEQHAFQKIGCMEALAFFAAQEPLFVVNGRTTSRPALVSRCGREGGRPPAISRQFRHHVVHVLSFSSGYSVTHYGLGDDGSAGSQVVTKIWEKTAGGWRIVHLHESSNGPAVER